MHYIFQIVYTMLKFVEGTLALGRILEEVPKPLTLAKVPTDVPTILMKLHMYQNFNYNGPITLRIHSKN